MPRRPANAVFGVLLVVLLLVVAATWWLLGRSEVAPTREADVEVFHGLAATPVASLPPAAPAPTAPAERLVPDRIEQRVPSPGSAETLALHAATPDDAARLVLSALASGDIAMLRQVCVIVGADDLDLVADLHSQDRERTARVVAAMQMQAKNFEAVRRAGDWTTAELVRVAFGKGGAHSPFATSPLRLEITLEGEAAQLDLDGIIQKDGRWLSTAPVPLALRKSSAPGVTIK